MFLMMLFLFSILAGRVEVAVRLGDGDDDDEDVRLICVALGWWLVSRLVFLLLVVVEFTEVDRWRN